MDDEIKDMFFRFFLVKTIKIAKKKIIQIFPYICSFFRIFAVRGVRLTFSCELLSESYLCIIVHNTKKGRAHHCGL